MRPIMISHCTGCGATLEHDSDPRTVLCGGCDADRRRELMKGAPTPPTVEYHYVPGEWKPGLDVLCMCALIAAGFIIGFLVRGGV